MHLHRESAQALALALVEQVGSVAEVDVAVCPPFPYLITCHEALMRSRIALGAQNLHFEARGAFTGEVSADMLKNCGCTYVIVGHSERRHVFGEDDESVRRKLKAALDAGLQPIFCVGELLEQREAGKTNEVVENQLRRGLLGIPPELL